MVEGGMKCVKYFLYIFSLLFVLIGLLVVAVGAYTQININVFDDLVDDYIHPGVVLIIAGILVFIVAFIGCLGACLENYYLIIVFAILLTVAFILEITAFVLQLVLRDGIASTIDTALRDNIVYYEEAGSDGITYLWDQLQGQLDCCGVDNYTDWRKILPDQPPYSCCKFEEVTDELCTTRSYTNIEIINTQGCTNEVQNWMDGKMLIIDGIFIGLAIVELVGILCACCLARAVKKEYEPVMTQPKEY